MQSDRFFARASVIANDVIAPGIHRLRFAVEGARLPRDAGAHVTFRLGSTDGTVQRTYSVVMDDDPADLTVAVKVMSTGRGGSVRMAELTAGECVDLIEFGNSMPASFGASNYVVIAGGIGVTPMTGLVRSLAGTGHPIKMHYAVRDAEQAVFADMFERMLGERFLQYTASRGELLDIASALDEIGPQTVLYLCGPQGLMDRVKAEWETRCLPIQNLRYETFASSGASQNQAFDVKVVETGRIVHVRADESLLDALVQSGHEVLNDCRKGECGLCKLHVDLATAPIDHRDVFLSPRERRDDASLCACVSRLPGGTMTVRIDGILHGRGH